MIPMVMVLKPKVLWLAGKFVGSRRLTAISAVRCTFSNVWAHFSGDFGSLMQQHLLILVICNEVNNLSTRKRLRLVGMGAKSWGFDHYLQSGTAASS